MCRIHLDKTKKLQEWETPSLQYKLIIQTLPSMYFININITHHLLQSELENEKTNNILLFYTDNIN